MLHLIVTTVRKAGWAPIVVLAAHFIASQVFDAYTSRPWIDVPMHIAGGVAIAYFAYVGLNIVRGRDASRPIETWAMVLVVLSTTALAAVLWECAEWASDRCFGTQSLGDATDTTKDMVLGIAGGLVVVCWAVTSAITDRRGC
jgi:hypothetical protein